jgi:hypothetical protein
MNVRERVLGATSIIYFSFARCRGWLFPALGRSNIRLKCPGSGAVHLLHLSRFKSSCTHYFVNEGEISKQTTWKVKDACRTGEISLFHGGESSCTAYPSSWRWRQQSPSKRWQTLPDYTPQQPRRQPYSLAACCRSDTQLTLMTDSVLPTQHLKSSSSLITRQVNNNSTSVPLRQRPNGL